MQLVATITGGGASLEFTNIPQTGTDLLLLVSQRITDASLSNESEIRVNGQTTGYRSLWVEGRGNAANSSSHASRIFWRGQGGSGSTAATFSNTAVYIPNYASTGLKTISIDSVSENAGTNAYQALVAASLPGTAAITTLTYRDYNGATLDGSSSASLYIITKGTGGATTSTA